MADSKVYNLRIPPTLYKRLLQLCIKTNKQRGLIIKVAIEKYVEAELKKDIPELCNTKRRQYH